MEEGKWDSQTRDGAMKSEVMNVSSVRRRRRKRKEKESLVVGANLCA
jgi:hypothetical protein